MIHGDFADIASVYEERDRDLALARLWPHPISLDFLMAIELVNATSPR
ncbi:hypothetical protein NR402_02070 [Acidithiobacillus ferrooxidans]|nr:MULTISPECIES: hypothetical protein [Acidithiobacillus]MCR2829077.1 hypothetical protein [Acidithiobacillus ferrooxidans]